MVKAYGEDKINDDENGPIDKLIIKTNRMGDSFRLDFGSSSIIDVMSTTIDSLDNDSCVHIGLILASGTYVCLAQKYSYSDYAAGLAFGYGSDKLIYRRKAQGSWLPVREI
jgi:hypothetical protein